MPRAALCLPISEFLATAPDTILGRLSSSAASLGFATQYTQQVDVWKAEINLLTECFASWDRRRARVRRGTSWWNTRFRGGTNVLTRLYWHTM